MTQLALAYDPAHVGLDHWNRKLEWLRRAVSVLGHKEVAYRLDVAPSQLTDALLERERKDVKAKWFDVVLAMDLPAEMRAEYVRLVCEATDYEMPRPKQRKTDAQQLTELREFLSTNAPGLLSMFERVR